MSQDEFPHGFVMSEAAIYSYRIQEVYPDVLSFVCAIPDHLKPLFLIPIQMTTASRLARVARRIASIPTGDTAESDLFGTKTFVTDDNEPMEARKDEGSIFDIDGAEGVTHHQENNWDENIQVPTDTSFMDVEPTEVRPWPYYAPERPTRHGSVLPVIVRLALRVEDIEPRIPEDVQERSESCSVKLVSYDKGSRIFTFAVNCGKSDRSVRASLTDTSQLAVACDCPFWQWNGPEYHAKSNDYLLGGPAGTAEPPNVRDPDRKYWLCKHSAAVLKRMDSFVQEVSEENWGLDDAALLKVIDSEWDRLEEKSSESGPEVDEEDVEVEVDDPDPSDSAQEEEEKESSSKESESDDEEDSENSESEDESEDEDSDESDDDESEDEDDSEDEEDPKPDAKK